PLTSSHILHHPPPIPPYSYPFPAPPPPALYTLSLHDALPILRQRYSEESSIIAVDRLPVLIPITGCRINSSNTKRTMDILRSEERRVGKEGRCRRWAWR